MHFALGVRRRSKPSFRPLRTRRLPGSVTANTSSSQRLCRLGYDDRECVANTVIQFNAVLLRGAGPHHLERAAQVLAAGHFHDASAVAQCSEDDVLSEAEAWVPGVAAARSAGHSGPGPQRLDGEYSVSWAQPGQVILGEHPSGSPSGSEDG